MGIDLTRERDPEILRTFAALQARELELLRKRLGALVTENAELKGVDVQTVLEATLAGVAAELNDPNGLESTSERRRPKTSKTRKKRRGHGPTDQPDLPVQETLYELDEPDRVCPKCGHELRPIDGLTEDSTEIDVVEVEYVVRKHRRQKYRCTCSDCQHIDTAMGPQTAQVVRGGRYSTRFAIEVIVDKYVSHLPLDRQVRRMLSRGLKCSSQTLWDYVWSCAKLLGPTWEALRKEVLRAAVIGADETRWRLMGTKDKAKPQIIAFTSEYGAWYGFEHDKTAETIDALLGDFAGTLVCDGISMYPAVRDRRELAYERLESEVEPFDIANCWVHARRNFIKASRGDPGAEEMIAMIGRLYRLKRAWDPDDAGLIELWREWVAALLKGMREWMHGQRPRPDSALEQAISYTDSRWQQLTRFVDDPEIWLDNNGTERALRGPVIGRKNHYGSRSDKGMRAAAVFYSLLETCQRLGVDSRAYLGAALARLAGRECEVYTPSMYLADSNH